jgi:hypothetical protein
MGSIGGYVFQDDGVTPLAGDEVMAIDTNTLLGGTAGTAAYTRALVSRIANG